MKILSYDQWLKEAKEQLVKAGLPDAPPTHIAFVCPACGTVQSMVSLLEAGVGANEAEGAIAFSCIGRFTNAGPPPPQKQFGKVKGCNWTLGGLFRIHTIEVTFNPGSDDPARPCFELATPEQTKELWKQQQHESEPKQKATGTT